MLGYGLSRGLLCWSVRGFCVCFSVGCRSLAWGFPVLVLRFGGLRKTAPLRRTPSRPFPRTHPHSNFHLSRCPSKPTPFTLPLRVSGEVRNTVANSLVPSSKFRVCIDLRVATLFSHAGKADTSTRWHFGSLLTNPCCNSGMKCFGVFNLEGARSSTEAASPLISLSDGVHAGAWWSCHDQRSDALG